MNEKFYNCVKKLHTTALFLTQNACKKNRFLTDSKITYFMNANE
jgi:hypothetical protein